MTNLADGTTDCEQVEVRRRLEEDIIFGRFAPGARLIEDSLVSAYGGTRHYIRQALTELEQKGIVKREKNFGATVSAYSVDEVRQIYEVREMLTRQAVLGIPLPAPTELVQRLNVIQAEYEEYSRLGDLRRAHSSNDAFHLTLFAACSNPYLVGSLKHYMSLTLPMRAKNLANRAGVQLSIRQHEIMIELLQGIDSWSLAQIHIDHIQYSKADYIIHIDGTSAKAPVPSLASKGGGRKGRRRTGAAPGGATPHEAS